LLVLVLSKQAELNSSEITVSGQCSPNTIRCSLFAIGYSLIAICFFNAPFNKMIIQMVFQSGFAE